MPKEGISRWDKKVITQELNYDWISYTKNILENIDSYQSNEYKIPPISHSVYFSKNLDSIKLKDFYISKSNICIERLNEAESNFKHYIWTNNPNLEIKELSSFPNVELKLVTEFFGHPLYKNIEQLLIEGKSSARKLVQASDIMRIMAMQKYGGIYHDLDYEIFDAHSIIKYMKSFNYFNSKEFDFHDSFVGNAFFSSSSNHPVINEMVSLISRNLNDKMNAPEYIQHPKTLSDEIFVTTGPVAMSIACYKSMNKDGNIDVIFPAAVFYNAKKVNPSITLGVSNQFHGLPLKTIGADMFLGSWQEDQTLYGINNTYTEESRDMNAKIDKIYVINLANAHKRWLAVSSSLDQLDIKYERFNAIHYNDIKVIDQKSGDEFSGKELNNNQLLLKYYHKYSIICNPNESALFGFNFEHIPVDYKYNIKYLGIMCSNFMIAKEIVDNKYKNVIIFEDDIQVRPDNFKTKLANFIDHLPSSFDFAYLGVYADKNQQEKLNDYVSKFIPEANFFCRMGLILSYKGAEKFLSNDLYWGSLDHYIRAQTVYNKIPNTDQFALEAYVSNELQSDISITGE
jgi:GR25 family glycosyltransferase involved in LPS biosynthesis